MGEKEHQAGKSVISPAAISAEGENLAIVSPEWRLLNSMEDVIIMARATESRQIKIAQRERVMDSFIVSYSPFLTGGCFNCLVYILPSFYNQVNNKTVTIR